MRFEKPDVPNVSDCMHLLRWCEASKKMRAETSDSMKCIKTNPELDVHSVLSYIP